ncbi:MAG: PIN domain-containing protein [Treponema sp.]|nr:PIN domain-containing protein [Treponema sp.]
MSGEKVFFDTNILVYFVDGNDTRKQNIAQNLVKKAVQNRNGIISTQSLQEFFNVITKKCLCSKSDAKTLVEMFSEQFPVTQVSVPQIQGAIDICIKHGVSFWDSLILSSANDSGCTIVYSEDMNNGQTIEGAKILNPFAN